MDRVIIRIHTQVLSKRCCFTSSQDSLEEQQLAVGHPYLTGLLQRSVTGCIWSFHKENSLASHSFTHAIAFGYIIVVVRFLYITWNNFSPTIRSVNMYGTIFLLQDFSEFLQHYTKMHKANYTDQSIHIWSIDRAPVCSANYIQLQLSQCHNLRSALWPSINFTQTNFDNQINCPLNVTSCGCCNGLKRPFTGSVMCMT